MIRDFDLRRRLFGTSWQGHKDAPKTGDSVLNDHFTECELGVKRIVFFRPTGKRRIPPNLIENDDKAE